MDAAVTQIREPVAAPPEALPAPNKPNPEHIAAAVKALRGPERCAILMLALGKDHGKPVWDQLDDEEVAQISLAMAKLGHVTPEVVEELLAQFISLMSMSGALLGNLDSTEKLLYGILPKERVSAILEEIRGPAGRNMWEKLSNVQANVLANYLKNEYPQTVAVVLSKIKPDHAARVLSILPEDLSLEVVSRMLGMESVQREILERIEQTLRKEFISNLSATRQRDAHELMADIFNRFDRQTEGRFLTALERMNRESAEKIRTLMFTFDDLAKLDPTSTQTLLRSVERDVLALSLKGTTDAVREFFFAQMSERAQKMLKDEISALGPVRLKEIDDAQMRMIMKAKELAASGEIVIAKGGQGEEIVY